MPTRYKDYCRDQDRIAAERRELSSRLSLARVQRNKTLCVQFENQLRNLR